MLAVELPYPPSTLISRKGRQFRQRVKAILAARRIEPLKGPLAIHVAIFPPNNRRRINKLPKALFDALEYGGAYRDDCQIVKLVIEKASPVPGGKTLVRIHRV